MREIAVSWWQRLSSRLRRTPDEGAARRDEFRAAVGAAVAGALHRPTLEALLHRAAADERPDEVELEVEMLHGARDLLDLQERVLREALPVVPHQHKALAGEPCHFLASVVLVSDAAQRTGRLCLTGRRLVFVATPLVALPWGAVARITDEGRDLVVAAPGRGAVHRFRCNSFADARCGRFVAERLKDAARG